VLRTTDVEAARVFYAAVLGDGAATIVPLPAEVLARGAPPHWLGHLHVHDVERAAGGFVDRGATRLGPLRRTDGGGAVQILRDPGGAVVAVASDAGEEPARICWQSLSTADLERSKATYTELFGWALTETITVDGVVLQNFAWGRGQPSVGSMAAIAGRPGVHPHWLFHFAVDELDSALAKVRAAGGVVIGPVAVSSRRVAVCDDPQGAAFALESR
jgi:predicted enzyme related to lactoylglutathione lyase